MAGGETEAGQHRAAPARREANTSASPRDVGLAASAFPDIQFVIYHSGYGLDPDGEEGPYDPAGTGVNRLVASLQGAGIGAGSNVWAELGSTP